MQHGYVQSFNGKMRDELLNETVFFRLDQAREAALVAGLRDAPGLRRDVHCNRLPTGHTTGHDSKSCWMRVQ